MGGNCVSPSCKTPNHNYYITTLHNPISKATLNFIKTFVNKTGGGPFWFGSEAHDVANATL